MCKIQINMKRIHLKYIILSIFILSFTGCDYKKVDEGNKPLKSSMKCGAGKCGSSMIETNTSESQKCGAVKIETH